MKIEFTRAEVERIILNHANAIAPYERNILNHANAIAPYERFNHIEPCGYRTMPDGFVVSTKEETENVE
jgi:hypothetical protein